MRKPTLGSRRSTGRKAPTKRKPTATTRPTKPKPPAKPKAAPSPNRPPPTFQAFVAAHKSTYLGVFQATGPIKGGLSAVVLKTIKPTVTGPMASYSVYTGKLLWVAFALQADFLAVKTLVGGKTIKPLLVGAVDGFGVHV
ncbi:hypothetical protein [Caulobacter rhizosphaerae]|uniref:hypothetical protein n=1 Tax=Caulobacter rhizosphaerae TaxID=2010972 RepID=UPI0013D3CBB2|nr:hypothetical protein [Caulobacter rhizosphaerae]GGL13160.1 hypothetical protein GCM10010983_08000 [Caulobacter rhizosphaerae]